MVWLDSATALTLPIYNLQLVVEVHLDQVVLVLVRAPRLALDLQAMKRSTTSAASSSSSINKRDTRWSPDLRQHECDAAWPHDTEDLNM